MWQILQPLFPKLLFFPPPKMDEFNFKLAQYCINSSVFGRFQNGCNKVVFEPCAVQFWSEIILVISNRTRAMRSVNFEITRTISAQIVLHSVQLPLFIILSHQWKRSVTIIRTYPRSLLEYSQHLRLYEHTYIYAYTHTCINMNIYCTSMLIGHGRSGTGRRWNAKNGGNGATWTSRSRAR